MTRLTPAQRRALKWIVAAPRTAGRCWSIEVHDKTHDALVRKGLIAKASGIVSILPAGRHALSQTDRGGERG